VCRYLIANRYYPYSRNIRKVQKIPVFRPKTVSKVPVLNCIWRNYSPTFWKLLQQTSLMYINEMANNCIRLFNILFTSIVAHISLACFFNYCSYSMCALCVLCYNVQRVWSHVEFNIPRGLFQLKYLPRYNCI